MRSGTPGSPPLAGKVHQMGANLDDDLQDGAGTDGQSERRPVG
jgi:hypothetical protein